MVAIFLQGIISITTNKVSLFSQKPHFWRVYKKLTQIIWLSVITILEKYHDDQSNLNAMLDKKDIAT